LFFDWTWSISIWSKLASNANGVTRLPLPHSPTLEENGSEVNLQLLESLSITAEQINKASKNDTVLFKVIQYTLNGLPEMVTKELKPYKRCHH